ncbi:MAG: thioesterase [Richelia sp. SM1_7_0]|nr:thioesterase [Richelia sp. SM1_7_0]
MRTQISINSWLTCTKPNPQAKVRLFCFPYAGGGSLIFREWSQELLPYIEVYTIQLPGRESRLQEPAFNRLQPLVEQLSQAILPNLNQPFAFFGHSMGGLIAFEVTRCLRRWGLHPMHLFISGARAPHLPDLDPPINNLPQTEFIEELRRFNGTPTTILENAELMELLLPTLRADFAVLETYIYTTEPPLSCPITVFGGLEDEIVNQDELKAWKEHTNQTFCLQMLPGNHFFLQQERARLLQFISRVS